MQFKKYSDILKKNSHLFTNENTPFKIVSSLNIISKWQKSRSCYLKQKKLPIEWANIGVLVSDPFIVVLRDLIEFPEGDLQGYIRLYNRAYLEEGAAGVVMLPILNGKVLLLHQYRHATRSWHFEIPRGFGEAGVSAKEQATIEIIEEIGGEIKELIELGLYHNNTGLEGNPIFLFLMRMAFVGKTNFEDGADKLRLVTIKTLERMIASGEITDGFTIAAYTRAKLKGLIK